MNQQHTEQGKPWYREFWPWFIIVLIGSVMVASLTTVYIAASGADQVVTDNYYKEGLTINRDLEKDQRALALNLSATLTLDEKSLQLALSQPINDRVVLNFIHPVEQSRDFALVLSSADKQHFSTELLQALSGRWYLEISDEHEQWRLKAVSNKIEGLGQLSFMPQGHSNTGGTSSASGQ